MFIKLPVYIRLGGSEGAAIFKGSGRRPPVDLRAVCLVRAIEQSMR